jgi:TRAP-type C4-dicarboxylate transport system permease small subunit
MYIPVTLIGLIFAGFAIYLGWRNMQQNKGAPPLPSDKYVKIAAVVCLIVGWALFALKR